MMTGNEISRRKILGGLKCRDILGELIKASSNIFNDFGRDRYSVAVKPFAGEKWLPVLYLFGGNHCFMIYHDLDTGEIQYGYVPRKEYSSFLKGIENDAVPPIGGSENPDRDENQEEF